ncbi:MAG TPA: hypothetical protein DEP89_05110 [Methylophilaceae bacterium]|nr:hypothetical protein [Methylophilaceae bacterium]
MAFFTLTDIKFTPKISSYNNKATIAGNEYDKTIKRFPSNLASDSQYGHYVVFYINTQTNTQFETGTQLKNTSTQVAANRQAIDMLRGAGTSNMGLTGKNFRESFAKTGIGNTLTSLADSVKNVTGAVGNSKVGKAASSFLDNSLFNFVIKEAGDAEKSLAEGIAFAEDNFYRSTKRTSTAIALYMPDNLNFNYQHSFNQVSPSSAFGAVPTAVMQAFNSAVDKKETDSTVKTLSPFIAEAITTGIGKITGNADQMFSAFTGLVNNPQMELLFQSTERRSFNFDFSLTPRSQQEAKDIMEIVRLFKFHAAPEILKGVSGRYLIPPSEFDISFFYNGTVNPNIPQISTCVLNSVSVNYAPDGWAAFEVSNNSNPSIGGTGMPVSIRLSLNFTETQIITKEYLTGPRPGGISSQVY